jgi:signal transduction histidine kinase
MLDIARRSSDRLKRLVDEFMDIQKLETGGMAFEFDVLDLMSIIEESIIASSAFAEQFGVRYLLGHSLSGVMVEADSDRIMQVLTNLLSNAAKYSHAGDLVEISVARHGEMVRISVTDHGPGVPESFRDEIFNPFTQAEPSLEDERHKDGAGLGLSIAKAIVEKHGGRIGFDSVHNTATTFYFDLPEWKIQPVNKQVHSG